MAFLKKAGIDSSPRTFTSLTEKLVLFNCSISLAFFSPCDWISLVIAEPLEWQISPSQTDFFYLDHHLHRMWNYSAGPFLEMGSKSTEKHEITEMHFFPSLPALHLQITFVPLALYVLDVSATVTAHARSQLLALFYFSPSALLPAHFVPLNFLGTLSHPFQIGLRLNLPCFMSLCSGIPHLI